MELIVKCHLPSSVILKKLSFDGTESEVVLDAELTAVFNSKRVKKIGIFIMGKKKKRKYKCQ